KVVHIPDVTRGFRARRGPVTVVGPVISIVRQPFCRIGPQSGLDESNAVAVGGINPSDPGVMQRIAFQQSSHTSSYRGSELFPSDRGDLHMSKVVPRSAWRDRDDRQCQTNND